MIDIAHVLPHFSERTLAELLRRDRVLIDGAQRTLDGLERIRLQVTEDQEIEAAKFETEYRRAVVRNLNKMELFGVDLSRASRSQPLSGPAVADLNLLRDLTTLTSLTRPVPTDEPRPP